MKEFALNLMTLLLAAVLCGCSAQKDGESMPAVGSGDSPALAAQIKMADIAEDAEYQTSQCGNYGYWPMTDGTVVIVRTPDTTDLTIPEKVDGYVVSTLADVTAITLKTVHIPDSLLWIIGNPFSGCSSLEQIHISPEHPTLRVQDGYLCSKDGKVLYSAFLRLDEETIRIPDGVQRIGARAFYNALDGRTAKHIVFPESLTSIGDYALDNCKELMDVTIPSTVTEVGDNPFDDCDKLRYIHVEQGNAVLEEINGVLFSKPDKRLISCPAGYTEETYSVPDGTLIIGNAAFSECKSLTGISIPDSVKSIGYSAFVFCEALTSIRLPDKMTGVISDCMFMCCESLESIDIPDSVTEIGPMAFFGCSSLKSVRIPDSVTRIGGSVFACCYSLTSIRIPDSVTSIEGSAFSSCDSLTSISIPASVTSIDPEAFRGCSALESVTVPYDSYARQWCEENNIPYTLMDSAD